MISEWLVNVFVIPEGIRDEKLEHANRVFSTTTERIERDRVNGQDRT